MKLTDILKEIEEAKKVNIDDLIRQGYTMGPEEIDPETGTTTSKVYNVSDFKKHLNALYTIYSDISKYKGSSKSPISGISKKINKDITQTVKDIKELEQYIELMRKELQ
jgi:hypothetical protein